MFVVTKQNRVVTYRNGAPTHKVTRPFKLVVTSGQVIAPMAIKLRRVETHNEVLPPIKSHDPLKTYPCEVTGYIKYITSSFALKQWPINVARC